MTGLEEMKAAIEEESRLECEAVERQAQEQLSQLRADAQAAASARYQEILADARRECDDTLKRAQTGGEMETRRLLLRTKTELVQETIDMALLRLRELPDDDYFKVIQTLALAYARAGEGEMRFSRKDLERMPAGFEQALNQALAKQGARVRVSSHPARFDGGFLLGYGDIEVNCSFEALLEASFEQVKDLLSRALFAE